MNAELKIAKLTDDLRYLRVQAFSSHKKKYQACLWYKIHRCENTYFYNANR